MTPDITVAIPTIPRRALGSAPPGESLLERAIDSVRAQTLPARIAVALDANGEGAAATRQRALDLVETEWVAFLDDDDIMYPNHLQVLHDLAEETGADYVWSWFDGNNPFPQHRGRQMDPENPHHTTMTIMVRTELAKAVGFRNHPDANEEWSGEDWQFILGCVAAGAKFAHTPVLTWHYSVHPGNTSGLPGRGDAA